MASAVKYLVDTNVFVYALDASDPPSKSKAAEWLTYLVERGEGAISTQALSELATVCLRKIVPPWSPDVITAHVAELATAFTVYQVTPAVVTEALRGVRDHSMSYFDAQMWAVARLNQVPYLLTQDMASGAVVDGVRIVDPLVVVPER